MAQKTIRVQTTGEFMLLDPLSLNEISAWGISEVVDTDWVRAKITEGKLVQEGKEKSEPKAEQADEPVRASAERGKVRGASQKGDINTVKSA